MLRCCFHDIFKTNDFRITFQWGANFRRAQTSSTRQLVLNCLSTTYSLDKTHNSCLNSFLGRDFCEKIQGPPYLFAHYKIGGHSITTWTRFCLFFTPSPPQLDRRGHLTNPLLMSMWTFIPPPLPF